MDRPGLIILLPTLTLGLAAAAGNGQDRPAPPAEQFAALKKEYDQLPATGPIKGDAERLKYVGRVYKHHFDVAPKLVALAEKYPADPVALDALIKAVWQVNNTPWPVELVGEDTARPRAFELIRRDHIRSDRLGPLCRRISYGFAKEYETFLRAALAESPHEAVRAVACLSLGQYLNNRVQRIDLCSGEPQLATEFAGLYGKDYLAELLRQDRAQAAREAEAFVEQAAEKYGSVKLPAGDTVGDRAKMALFEIRRLSVGQEAPDIGGADEDGKTFRLSDYRGKVVLLDFWSFV
jgi:hypothetical protein